MTPVPRLRAYAGPALLTYGFRPFFLFGAIYAGLTVLAWLPMFYGELEVASAFAPVDWHVHEMLYGYLPAIVTGFLLTAIPNWTGRLADPGHAAAGAVRGVAGGPRLRHVVRADRLAGGRDRRCQLPDPGHRRRRARDRRRQELAKSPGHRHGDVAARRQYRVSSRGACARSCRIRHPHRHRGHRAAARADRRPHHSELHPQLAGARESGTAAGAVRALRWRHALP